jgi:RND family efflux transporter MFP subunit
MNTKVDLGALARERPGPEGPPRRRWLSLVALPAALLAGFAVLAGVSLRGVLSPPRPVTVAPVMTVRGSSTEAEGTPLFRAAGWAEPSPAPVIVTALTEGVVAEMLAVEGQELTRGQVVARLVKEDAELEVSSSEASRSQRLAELQGAKAARAAAAARLESPLHLKAELAESRAALARAEAELEGLPSRLQAAEARLDAAKKAHERLASAGPGAVSEASVVKARGDLGTAEAEAAGLLARKKRLPDEAAALRQRHEALQLRLERLTDEKRAVAEAQAAEAAAEARLKQAEAALAQAKLRLTRMEVRAPISGRVLSLVARQGARLTGLAPGSLHDSSTVLTMYDPARLQVRADVRLEDVPRLRPGMRARIEAAPLGSGALDGVVARVTYQADVQKNTLPVKVLVTSPPGHLSPEMLCQVTFLAPPTVGKPAEEAVRLLIPRSLVEGGERVWVADQASGVARQRVVKLGPTSGDLAEVLSGLSPTDKLIVGGRDGLREGDRVAVTGEDDSLGVR